MSFKPLPRLAFIFSFLFVLTACNLQGEQSSIDSAYSPGKAAATPTQTGAANSRLDLVIAFQSSQSSHFDLGSAPVEFTSNSCKLSTPEQTDHSNSGTSGFAAGTLSGVQWNSSPGNLSLSASAYQSELATTGWTPQPTHLSGLWHLNETSGPTISDSSGHGNAGSVVSASLGVSGKLSSGFDLSNGYVSTPVIPSPLAYTKAAWINLTASPTTCSNILSSMNMYSGTWCDAFAVCNGVLVTGHNGTLQLSGPVISPNQWHYVAATYDSAVGSGTSKLFVDGQMVGSAAPVAANCSDTNEIGSVFSNSMYSFKGTIDEAAIWDVALKPSEIKDIYEHQQGSFAGTYTSRVIDGFNPAANWTELSWKSSLPFGKELPDFQTTVQNESTADYGSASSTLMNGNIALWHLNESAAGTVAGGSRDALDSSGHTNHLIKTGTPGFGAEGRFGKGVHFDGASFLASNSAFNLTYASGVTVSAWFKTTSTGDAKIVASEANSGTDWSALQTFSGYPRMCSDFSCVVGTTLVNDGVWHHMVFVSDATTERLILDGNTLSPEASKPSSGSLNSKVVIGASLFMGGSFFMDGTIDEVAMWNRTLSDSEIKELYARGSQRLKFQVRTCTTPSSDQKDCLDDLDQQKWFGPDGTQSTYYSELNNITGGWVNAASPMIDFTHFVYPSPAPAGTRYVQYHAVLESDSATSTPDVSQITVGPLHYGNSTQGLNFKDAITFSTLSRMNEILGSSGCTSGVAYNFGVGTTYATASWYYWNVSHWVSTSGADDLLSSSAALLNASSAQALVAFPNEVATSGKFYLKTFLRSSGTSVCELQSVEFLGTP